MGELDMVWNFEYEYNEFSDHPHIFVALKTGNKEDFRELMNWLKDSGLLRNVDYKVYPIRITKKYMPDVGFRDEKMAAMFKLKWL